MTLVGCERRILVRLVTTNPGDRYNVEAVRKHSVDLVLVVAAFSSAAFPQTKLSPKWEELTAPDFVQAIHQSQGVCVLPIGIIEKHGPHLPLGTDLLDVRFAVMNAVQQEYAVVFPSTTSARSSKRSSSRAPSPTASARSSRSCRRR